MRTKLIALAAFSTLFLASCKKGNNDTETKTEIVTKSSWKLDTYGVDTNGDLVLAGNEIEIRDCDRDDVITFSTSGTANFNSGADNCGAPVYNYQDTWTFHDNETIFVYKGNRMRIINLTNTKLELHSGGPVSTYIVILKK